MGIIREYFNINNNNNNNPYFYSLLLKNKLQQKKILKVKIRVLAAWNNHGG